MDRTGILWTIAAFVGGLFSVGGGLLSGIATNKAVANAAQPTIKLTAPVSSSTPEVPPCPPAMN